MKMFNLAFYTYTILLGFTLNSQSDQNIHNLNIIVSEFESYNGVLRVCITDNKADFLESCLYSKSILIDNNFIEIEFKNLKMGVYAVSVYQDENSNGVLETDGLFGLPSEPFGFSNNTSIAFGPPSFKKSSFNLKADKTINIKLK